MGDTRIYRDEETVKEYGRRLKEIERRINEINVEIGTLENQLI